MRIQIVIAGIVAALASAAFAADWGSYGNTRFDYSIDVPPGFSQISESDSRDGGVSSDEDGLSQLAVWGASVEEKTLAEEFSDRIESAKKDGWDISYRRETKDWASWSGSVDGRIFYARAIRLCNDEAAYFLLEYPKARKKSFDPIIKRLVKSLKSEGGC